MTIESMACPVCGVPPEVSEGRYVSLIDGSVLTVDQLGKPGPGYFFERESDFIRYPCGGFVYVAGQPPGHLTDLVVLSCGYTCPRTLIEHHCQSAQHLDANVRSCAAKVWPDTSIDPLTLKGT